jgi:hypothetical protein
MVNPVFAKKDRRDALTAGGHRTCQPQRGQAQAAAPRALVDDNQDFHVKLSVDENMTATLLSK